MTRPATSGSGATGGSSARVSTEPTARADEPPVAQSAEAPKAAGLSPGWRVALFVWVTAFLFLLLYELLTTLVRSLPRLF